MEILLNSKNYEVIKLLGKGKGGYSYLVKRDGELYVLKQIHHEPCSYYQFNDKIGSEKRDYEQLTNIGIKMPRMVDIDITNERILKEYIDGPTIEELVKENKMKQTYFDQLQDMLDKLYPAKTNIDYYPTNFIVSNDVLYYIDYECNDYMDEWNFENWGIKYWK